MNVKIHSTCYYDLILHKMFKKQILSKLHPDKVSTHTFKSIITILEKMKQRIGINGFTDIPAKSRITSLMHFNDSEHLRVKIEEYIRRSMMNT